MSTIPLKTLINYSPNFSTYKRNIKSVKYLIYHYTGMRSESKAINRLTDVKSEVSCHYFIKRNGSIILIVPEAYEAWHAGKSNWKKDTSLNMTSLARNHQDLLLNITELYSHFQSNLLQNFYSIPTF